MNAKLRPHTKRIKGKHKNKTSRVKSSNILCKSGFTFAECELEILNNAIIQAEKKQHDNITLFLPETKKIMKIVEDFLRKKELVIYGGTAQNNILPKNDQFYDNVDIPDYDFFSPNAMTDTKELSDLYAKAGYIEVDAKSGVHLGTYKVFVNFIPVADITQMPVDIFNTLNKDVIKIDGLVYAPANFLRMGMYLELSRPDGDTSRWEKVYKRLVLLNKHYPLNPQQCAHIEFQRPIESTELKSNSLTKNQETTKQKSIKKKEPSIEDIYDNVLDIFINNDVVFFGGYAISKYSQYMPHHIRERLLKIPDFDVLSEDAKQIAEKGKERLIKIGCKNVSVQTLSNIGEIVSGHYEIKVGEDIIAFIYQPTACHSYNILHENRRNIRIATIDTMLSFYLAFLYTDKEYYDVNRIQCMSKYLFDVQSKNRLSQKGLLKRFSTTCIGHQETLKEIRKHKADLYQKLSDKKGSKEYEEMFFRYRPSNNKKMKTKTTIKNVVDKKSSTNKKTNKIKKVKKVKNNNVFRVF